MTGRAGKNRLADETSPYLLQHAGNPVDWYPWGEEALARARDENLPILLSVGYSACHWCHVMEHESFENEDIAALMNQHFVSIKVDREERPDIDEIYMNAVQIMTGSGGWPLTVFLTPELKPFYGGTYFPPEDKWGRPGFDTVLREIHRVYEQEQSRIQEASETLTERLQSLSPPAPSEEMLTASPIAAAARELSQRFDSVEGGFSAAPKFPPSGALALLMRHYRTSHDRSALDMVELTLDKMASGGMYDHLGGGFHRYSTDASWLVPHFEKMLYDNALLVPVYLEAFQLTGNEHYARVARECLDWVLREMQGDSGGYYSTQDADSEGVEGKFYVWSLDEIEEELGDDAAELAELYDVTTRGNWEGTNILHLPDGLASFRPTLDGARTRLENVRAQRIHPSLDDKILTSWNGLMMVAMARGYRVLGDERYLDSARAAASFIEDQLYEGERLLATHRNGRSKLKSYLDDHAFLLAGLVELYACDFEPRWLERASQVARAMKELFFDPEKGGFYFTGSDHEALITRTKTGFDGAIPSGNAVAATYLLKLAEYTGDRDLETLAVATMRAFQAQLERSPSGFAQMLAALSFYLSEKREVVVAGRADAPAVGEALREIRAVYAPHLTVALLDPEASLSSEFARLPLLEGKSPGPDPASPRFYLCESYTCQAPTDSLADVLSALDV